MNLRQTNWLIFASALSLGLVACGGGGNGGNDGGSDVVVNSDTSMNEGGGSSDGSTREGGTLDGGGNEAGSTDGGSGNTDGGSGNTDGGNGNTDGGSGNTDGGSGGGCTPVSALNPAGDTKTGALAMTGGVITSLGCSVPGSDLTAGEQTYSLHVAQSTQFTIATTPTDSALDTVIAVRRVCSDATTEIDCNDDTGGGLASSLTVVLPAGDYVVIVDAYTPDPGVTLDYMLTLAASTPAAGSDCSMPIALTPGTPLTGQDTAGGFTTSAACQTFNDGGQLFYSLTIPAGQRATITATPGSTSTLTPVVRVLTSCTADTCLASNAASSSGTAAQTVLDNRGTAPETVIVSVSGTSGTDNGTFDLSATLAAAPAIPANAMCSMATTINNGSMVSNQDPSLGTDDLTGPCLGLADGKVLYYSVTVPAGQFLEATATPVAGLDVAVRLLSACAATDCAASADNSGSGTAETLSYHNTTTASQTLIIAVGATDPGMNGTFSLAVNIVPPPANAMCAAATVLTSGANLTNQDSSLGADTLLTTCQTNAGGTVLYYRAIVPMTQTLTVTVTPTGTMDPVIRLLSACGATSCLDSVDAGSMGDPETLTYQNTGTTPATVVIAVGNYTAGGPGAFSIAAMIQ